MTGLIDNKLLITLLVSLVIHLFIVFGVSFNVFSPPENAPVNTLDITLVKEQTVAEPEEAEYLAQATNEGGGDPGESSPTPTVDLPVPLTEDTPTSTPPVVVEPIDIPVPEEIPTPVEPEMLELPAPEIVALIETPEPDPEPTPPEPEPISEPVPEPLPASEKLTTDTAETVVESSDLPTEAPVEQTEAIEPERPQPSARDLMAQARSELSTLQDQLAANSKSLSEQPKRRRISAATTEYAAAAYMRAWEMKVERIGNMNYPQQAREQNINGNLILSVDIRPDGSVPADGIVVSRSSGYQVLDDAAIRIVRMGAPYAQIPEDVLQGNDMLTIIRTWRFESQRGLSTR